ncbi:cytochrome-c peroxidase [Malassezia sp. CBS 17886]|nr:cytochrome-c peroxidase [Malassezia sp. CBS 17886]
MAVRAYNTRGEDVKQDSKGALFVAGAAAFAVAGYSVGRSMSRPSAGGEARPTGKDDARPTGKDAKRPSGKDGRPSVADYQEVYNAIADKFESNPNYDAGSYAPVVLRLAWHSSGTYDKASNTGGSNGATMRFPIEANYDANAGLEQARIYLAPFKKQFPWITYADLWTLGGVAAVQEMGGPTIPWRPGRVDKAEDTTPPDGRLPDGAKDADHVRNVFQRMGFNDQDMTALIGAHAVGQCHHHRSGFDGPWTFSQISFTNEFFHLLLSETWQPKKWDGPFQYENKSTGTLMMLPSDYSLSTDGDFKRCVQKYADDEELFFKDFASAFARLLELGVPAENFQRGAAGFASEGPIHFKTVDQQDEERDEKEGVEVAK